jgi:hypothetical protein
MFFNLQRRSPSRDLGPRLYSQGRDEAGKRGQPPDRCPTASCAGVHSSIFAPGVPWGKAQWSQQSRQGQTVPMTTAASVPAGLVEELYGTCLEVAKGAAKILVSYASRRPENVETKSSPTDLVSEADRASERFIADQLRRLRPDDSLFGEEGASHEGSSGVSWWADPLDGTTNFVFGIPAWAVSLAATFDGRTVAGAVVDPSRGEVWSAALGRGAWCNGIACHVAEGRSDLATALVLKQAHRAIDSLQGFPEAVRGS